jgi:hypothetical protein
MFGFFAKFFAKKKETWPDEFRRDIALDVERICLDALVTKIFPITDALAERLSVLEEQGRQAQRQERRRQAALDFLLENQEKILKNQDKVFEILERLETFPSPEPLMSLAENFVLSFLAEPENPTSLVLYGKMANLLSCFGLSLIAETGCAFDPEKHEACAVRRDLSRPEDSVLEIVRPGFLLKDRVLRCAIVVVNRYNAETEGIPLGFDDISEEQKLWEGEFYV